jgi:hypothetical protein
MAVGGLYELLLEAMRQKELGRYSRPGMTPEDPAETARRYGDDNNPNDETSGEIQQRNPNFRQVSPAPWVAAYQRAYPSLTGADASQDAGSFGASSETPKAPWWAPQPPPIMVGPGGRFLPVSGRFPTPQPFSARRSMGQLLPMPGTGSTNLPPIPMPEAWKQLRPLLELMPELLREGLMGEVDDSTDQDAAVDPITELEIGRGKGAGRKRKSKVPPSINGKKPYVQSPSIVPEASSESGIRGNIVAGRGSDKQRCLRASSGSTDTWDEFCRSLTMPWQRAQCFNKTHRPDARQGWCGELDEN